MDLLEHSLVFHQLVPFGTHRYRCIQILDSNLHKSHVLGTCSKRWKFIREKIKICTGGAYPDDTFLGNCWPAIFNFVVVQLGVVQFGQKSCREGYALPVRKFQFFKTKISSRITPLFRRFKNSAQNLAPKWFFEASYIFKA